MLIIYLKKDVIFVFVEEIDKYIFFKYIIYVFGKNWMILIYCKFFKLFLIIWYEYVFYKCYCLNVYMNIIYFLKSLDIYKY